MRHLSNARLVACVWLILWAGALYGCGMLEPGPEGDRARKEVHDTIRSVVPSPWGEIAATIVTTTAGAIAFAKNRKASRMEVVAEAACTAIEASGNKELKHAAHKASRLMGVPHELEHIVSKIEKKNGNGNGHANGGLNSPT